MVRLALVAVLATLVAPIAAAQQPTAPTLAPRAAGGSQVGDTAFAPSIEHPAFRAGTGPLVLLDEAHHNFHTVEGRYAPFVKLLRRDGFVVEPLRAPFSAAALRPARVLVIANALAERNAAGDWSVPTPSAFTPAEIAAVREWVRGGGSLLLIADHMPFPGAAEDLGRAFGFEFINGFATDRSARTDEFGFRRSDGSLADHPITRGRDARERVDSVRSFTGQAFALPPGATGLLHLAPGSLVLVPTVAWQFSDSTPRVPADGMVQGAVLEFGAGRVAVFGEAAMFSAQVSGAARRPMGMNAPKAGQNPRFLLNVLHWLSGLLPVR
ncbi:MAG: DUF4350 domain-containing protein [Gemmatimonadales bacterium]|nr:DUF4350 domain-containing protein [Gemmatimonadales bacterium]